MFEAEHEAKMVGAERIVLDVEKDNIGAITVYKKLGYKTIKEFSIPLQKDKSLHFNRMTREVR
jgi:ribosomal protein S18 acetylase RimI-like enzyme